MRNALGIFDKTWASSAGDNAVIPTGIENGYGSEYAIDTAPDRRHMNDILAKATAVCTDVNKYGAALPWDTGITYEQYTTILGSDGVLYVAQQQHSAKDPTSPANRPTFWKTLADVLQPQFSNPYMRVADVKTEGTHGGVRVGGAWTDRDLNTVFDNTITGASLEAGNIIRLPAGTYKILCNAPFGRFEGHTRAVLRMYDTTGAVSVVDGQPFNKDGGSNEWANIMMWMRGRFTLSQTSDLQVQYFSESYNNTKGLGHATDLTGIDERYTEIEIEQII